MTRCPNCNGPTVPVTARLDWGEDTGRLDVTLHGHWCDSCNGLTDLQVVADFVTLDDQETPK